MASRALSQNRRQHILKQLVLQNSLVCLMINMAPVSNTKYFRQKQQVIASKIWAANDNVLVDFVCCIGKHVCGPI